MLSNGLYPPPARSSVGKLWRMSAFLLIFADRQIFTNTHRQQIVAKHSVFYHKIFSLVLSIIFKSVWPSARQNLSLRSKKHADKNGYCFFHYRAFARKLTADRHGIDCGSVSADCRIFRCLNRQTDQKTVKNVSIEHCRLNIAQMPIAVGMPARHF